MTLAWAPLPWASSCTDLPPSLFCPLVSQDANLFLDWFLAIARHSLVPSIWQIFKEGQGFGDHGRGIPSPRSSASSPSPSSQPPCIAVGSSVSSLPVSSSCQAMHAGKLLDALMGKHPPSSGAAGVTQSKVISPTSFCSVQFPSTSPTVCRHYPGPPETDLRVSALRKLAG